MMFVAGRRTFANNNNKLKPLYLCYIAYVYAVSMAQNHNIDRPSLGTAGDDDVMMKND